jgi:hypothetical protein
MVAGERRLSMLDLGDANGASQRSNPGHESRRRRRRRALVGCTAFAVALHLAFLDGLSGSPVRPPDAATTPMSVRTIAAEPAPAAVAANAAAVATVAAPPAPEPVERSPRRWPSSHARSPTPEVDTPAQATAQVSTSSPNVKARALARPVVALMIEQPAIKPAVAVDVVEAVANPASGSDGQPAANTASSVIPGMGDRPPPVYPTRLPPAATLHYQVRRGFLRGDGEIRWRPAGNAYHLVLEAGVAGLTLLVQTSEGAIDRNGLEPTRFLDQRARRSAQAANFVRERSRITFSGTTVEWPLIAGVQDRLSWMIQLAGIVAADPALLHEGSRITMAVVGARGDADVWSLRYIGQEAVETPGGRVAAFKLIREGHGPNDTTAEVWLDPARSYLPARATLGNSSGAPEYDLLLSRIDP